jgi:hypothetical protein
MTYRFTGIELKNRHRLILTMILCLFALGLITALAAPRKRAKKVVDERVYLNHADELKYDIYGPNPEAQIAKGRVSFLIAGHADL